MKGEQRVEGLNMQKIAKKPMTWIFGVNTHRGGSRRGQMSSVQVAIELEGYDMRPAVRDTAPTAPRHRRKTTVVAVNDQGHAIGEDHPRAVLTNHEVALLLELRAEGYSLQWLADKFEIGKSTVHDICTGRNRSQHATGFVRQRRRGR